MRPGALDGLRKLWQQTQQTQQPQESPQKEVPESQVKNDNQREIIKTPRNASEAELIGNRIFGRSVCFFNNNDRLEALQETLQALSDIKQDFPLCYDSVLKFGNRTSGLDRKRIMDEYISKIENVSKSLNVDSQVLTRFLNLRASATRTLGESSLGFRISDEGNKWGKFQFYLKDRSEKRLERRDMTLTPNVIVFKPMTYDSSTWKREEFKKSFKVNVQTNYHRDSVRGMNYSIVAHELGHLCHRSLNNHFSREEKNALTEMYFSAVKQKISNYGKKDEFEFVAEAFADYYGNADSPENILQTNKDVVLYLKGLYDKYLGGQ